MKIDAVVLAGGDAASVDPDLKGPKSLIDIGGRPMISYVAAALAGCRQLSDMVITLPAGVDPSPFKQYTDKIVVDSEGVVDAIDKAVGLVGAEGYVLVVSSDLPMITTEALDDFLAACVSEPADIYYSVVPREAAEAAFPGTQRTYMRLVEGSFTGGNVHLAKKEEFMKNRDIGRRMFALRKSPLGLLRLLGLGFVIRFACRRLTINILEKKAGQLLDCKVKAVVARHAALGVDVDKREDLQQAQAYLARDFGK